MKTAIFKNWTGEEFIGYWDGKGKKFPPGSSLYMPDFLARHFAKHLTNRELLRRKPNGEPVYRDGEKMTSPKKPEDVPIFMDLFNRAYQVEDTGVDETKKDDLDVMIDSANKNRSPKGKKNSAEVTDVEDPAKKKEVSDNKKSKKQDPNEPQYIETPEDDEDEDEADSKDSADEDEFEESGK